MRTLMWLNLSDNKLSGKQIETPMGRRVTEYICLHGYQQAVVLGEDSPTWVNCPTRLALKRRSSVNRDFFNVGFGDGVLSVPASISSKHRKPNDNLHLAFGFDFFQGPIPEELGALSELKELRLSNNELTGEVRSSDGTISI